MQAATTKITIMATTMEVTKPSLSDSQFRQSVQTGGLGYGAGKELSYGSYSRYCGAGATAMQAVPVEQQLLES